MAESALSDLTLFVLTSKTTFCLGPFCVFERKIFTVTFVSTYFYSLFQTNSFFFENTREAFDTDGERTSLVGNRVCPG